MLKAKLAHGLLLACLLLIGSPAQAEAPIVAAASDLQFALTEAVLALVDDML